jgi:hypothetical protein
MDGVPFLQVSIAVSAVSAMGGKTRVRTLVTGGKKLVVYIPMIIHLHPLNHELSQLFLPYELVI